MNKVHKKNVQLKCIDNCNVSFHQFFWWDNFIYVIFIRQKLDLKRNWYYFVDLKCDVLELGAGTGKFTEKITACIAQVSYSIYKMFTELYIFTETHSM